MIFGWTLNAIRWTPNRWINFYDFIVSVWICYLKLKLKLVKSYQFVMSGLLSAQFVLFRIRVFVWNKIALKIKLGRSVSFRTHMDMHKMGASEKKIWKNGQKNFFGKRAKKTEQNRTENNSRLQWSQFTFIAIFILHKWIFWFFAFVLKTRKLWHWKCQNNL